MHDQEFSRVGFYAAAWLVIARLGGWSKIEEIVAQLPIDIDAANAHSDLWIMAYRYGMLKTRGFHASREYAVTADCLIPKGVRAGEVAEAIAAARSILQEETPA